jgi:hypothetical protein
MTIPLTPELTTCAGCGQMMPAQVVTEGKGDREESYILKNCLKCREEFKQALREWNHVQSI